MQIKHSELADADLIDIYIYCTQNFGQLSSLFNIEFAGFYFGPKKRVSKPHEQTFARIHLSHIINDNADL